MFQNVLHGFSFAAYLASTVSYISYFVNKRDRTGFYATYILLAGLVTHFLFLLVRTIDTGYIPFANLFEVMTLYAWLVALIYLVIEYNLKDKTMGAFLIPFVLAIQSISLIFLGQGGSLSPILKSFWFEIHVATSILGYSALTISFVTGIMYVLQASQIKTKQAGLFFLRLPPLEMLDRMNYKGVSIGFSFLTVGILVGSFWASKVWGSFWSWDPKQISALITWLIYAFLLYTRLAMGWQGRRAGHLSILGFLTVLFSYFGANLFLTKLHLFY